jgi:hypothetical protein
VTESASAGAAVAVDVEADAAELDEDDAVAARGGEADSRGRTLRSSARSLRRVQGGAGVRHVRKRGVKDVN